VQHNVIFVWIEGGHSSGVALSGVIAKSMTISALEPFGRVFGKGLWGSKYQNYSLLSSLRPISAYPCNAT
jgi:hypothetical protein